ncbi:MAG: flagellar hook-associated protein FlgL [Candidatus Scalindua rubra]|uniref:Flagellar hook-associated protein FlgL n=1 Tax=Candidatus Scalindua brodae TaxID=237368 RepID=A0A0B0EEF4_9BACT|nr:MAG: flagellar hook-associated protein FlgL [Candidatus Scalindua brodae]MBZ0108298.1 flagellar hook-associated protein FlgL [Candidatus Scalindua rubra]TWU33995.1 Flagellar hook-associated protein 3 [Candidatus Brocadiaceae bacterium S225]
MSTRVNLETFISNTLANVQKSTSNMSRLQEQISTGKRVNRVSDDPAGARKILSLRSEDLMLDQYASNIQTATQSLDFSASALQNTSDILVRITELTMQGVSDSTDQGGRTIIANEINQLLETIMQSANAQRLGRFTFAGTETSTEPFVPTRNSSGDISAVTYNGNRETIEYNVGPNINTVVNLTGDEVFVSSNLFDTIIKIRDNLSDGSITFARNELGNLDNASQNILNSIAKAGGISNTLELTGNRITDTKLSLQEVLASAESADIAELVLKLTEQQNIFEASLSSGSYIFKTSILNYL